MGCNQSFQIILRDYKNYKEDFEKLVLWRYSQYDRLKRVIWKNEGDGSVIEELFNDSFFEQEKNDPLPYFVDCELIDFARKELPQKEYMEFEELLNRFAAEVSYYWFNKGVDTMRSMVLLIS